MSKWKHSRKWFSVFMTAVLVLTLTTPAFGSGGKTELRSVEPQSKVEKVSAKLTEQFKSDEYVTYLIKMKEQADTATVSRNAKERSLQKKDTPAMTKLAMRNAVLSSLREISDRTQSELIQELEKMKDRGDVKDFESFFIVNALAITSTQKAMEAIAARAEVAKILPNEERYLDKVEKSTSIPTAQLENVTNNIEWNIDKVGAPQVWSMGIDGSGIVVANLDTGVEVNHPALQRKWRGYDANGNVVNPELSWFDAHSHSATLPTDTDGHGSHTMGTMVGSEDDGSNQIGVAPGAKWIAVRVFNPSTTDQILLRAGQWLLAPVDSEGNLHPEMAPDVVNNSWGGGPGIDEWYRPTVQAWRDAQIFPVFSAGNTRVGNPGGPGSVANPANYPESFAIGATDINNKVASFSLRGPSPYGEIKPEVSAPGVNIRSSVPGGDYEGGWNGTSMSAPHATATAALLLSVNASLTVDQLEEILITTATPLTDSEYTEVPNHGYGYGLVNAYDAVGSILNGLGNVSGRVSTDGDDFEAPVLEHSPITNAYTGFDIPLSAHVTDNISVVSVEAFARIKGTSYWTYVPLNRTSGDYMDGMYEGVIPYTLVDTAGVEYYIRVNDYGNNGFESPKHSVEVSNGVTPGFFQDFESHNLGFTSGGNNDTWEWGVPTSGPGAAASGTKLIATNLEGPYLAGSNAYMMMPPIDLLQSEEGALLSFKHWYDLENNYDYGVVFIASEASGYEFEPIMEFTGLSNGWKKTYVDLTAYAGQQVYVLFNLFTDNSVQKDGWYIDDVSVMVPDDVAPLAPTQLTATSDALGKVTLNWSAVSDEDVKDYVIHRSTQSGSAYEMIGSTSNTSFEDTDTTNGTTYFYVVTAKDYSSNESSYSNEVSVIVSSPEVIYSDDFEGGDDNGWTHSGTKDEWERGAPIAGPGSAYAGSNLWGTDLDDKYENGSNYSLVSPAIDLTSVTSAALTFQHWYEIEGGTSQYDKGFVEITNDGGATWNQLALYSHSTNGKLWTGVSLDLNPFVGNTIQVRFRLTSDNSIQKFGWYIDNFQVLNIAMPTKDRTKSIEQEAKKPDFSLKSKDVYDGGPALNTSRTEKDSMINVSVESGSVIQSLPASATVTVLESGRSAKTDPSNGRYNLVHVAGDFTLRAETYGFYPHDRSITIADGETALANFVLQPIPKGTITGSVTNERDGAPIAGATVMVMDDARVTPVKTNSDGTFSLEVLEGDYTLAVSAPDYYNKTVSVSVAGNESVTIDVTLKLFIGYPGAISYDDGTAENARAFYDAGNGWAVRMTPESPSAQVTGALFRFWDTEWPVPGGTDFQYAVYDASGPDGSPGRVLAGPFNGTALRNGEWTEVTFESGVMVNRDFYIVYIQADPNPNSPGLATDEDGTNALRSWQIVGGAWSPSPEEEGNYMIRALVNYEVGAPIITSPADNTYTNETSMTVVGTSSANGATINLHNGDGIVGNGTVENGQFSVPITLNDGMNLLSAEAVVNGKTTDRSLTVNVTLDQVAPNLDVTSPTDGVSINKEVVDIIGTTTDEHFSTLLINDQNVIVNEIGSFSHKILVQEGANIITISSMDLAGNVTNVTRTVHVDLHAPEITNISPSEDVHLSGDEVVIVSFDSEAGMSAAFRIELPLMVSGVGQNEIVMIETAPGHYEGSWTTSENLSVEGAIIVVRVWDESGNVAEAVASGKLYVTPSEDGGEEPVNQLPTAVIQAPDSAKDKKDVQFDGTQSHDVDGTIVSYAWDFGDGATATNSTASHRYAKPGTYTVTLTVTDDQGAIGTVTHQISISK